MKTGMTSNLKLIGRSTVEWSTTIGTDNVRPPNLTASSVFPSVNGESVALSKRTNDLSLRSKVASEVTSRVAPSAYMAWTINVCLSCLLERFTSGGKIFTSIGAERSGDVLAALVWCVKKEINVVIARRLIHRTTNPDKQDASLCSHGPFPLSPALSLGERE